MFPALSRRDRSLLTLLCWSGEQAFLVVDKVIVCECTPIENIPLLLLSPFFFVLIYIIPRGVIIFIHSWSMYF